MNKILLPILLIFILLIGAVSADEPLDSFDRTDRVITGDLADNGNAWGGNANIINSEVQTVSGTGGYLDLVTPITPANSDTVNNITGTMRLTSGGTAGASYFVIKNASTTIIPGFLFVDGGSSTWKVQCRNGVTAVTLATGIASDSYNTFGLVNINFATHQYDCMFNDVLYDRGGLHFDFAVDEDEVKTITILSSTGSLAYWDDLKVGNRDPEANYQIIDTFERSDRLLNGDAADNGQDWSCVGSTAPNITNGKAHFTDTGTDPLCRIPIQPLNTVNNQNISMDINTTTVGTTYIRAYRGTTAVMQMYIAANNDVYCLNSNSWYNTGYNYLDQTETKFGFMDMRYTTNQYRCSVNGVPLTGLMSMQRATNYVDTLEIITKNPALTTYDNVVEGATANPGVSLSNLAPNDRSNYNHDNINISVDYDTVDAGTCSLLNNGAVQENTAVSTGASGTLNYNFTVGTEGFYTFKINCTTDFNVTSNTELRQFLYDINAPTINTNFTNGRSFHAGNNVTGTFNFSDNIILNSLNVSIDGNQIFVNESIGQDTYDYLLNYNTSGLTNEQHNLTVRVADGHTAKELRYPDEIDITNGLFNDYLEYDFSKPYKKGKFKFHLKDQSLFDTWDHEKKVDKIKEKVKPNNPKNSMTFIVESTDNKINIINDPKGNYGSSWLVIGDQWKDFVLENEPLAEVSITKINDYYVEVTIDNIQNPTELVFESTGDLNVVQNNYTFDVYTPIVNITNTPSEVYNNENFDTTGLITFNGTPTTPNLEFSVTWNGSSSWSISPTSGLPLTFSGLSTLLSPDITGQEILPLTWNITVDGYEYILTENVTVNEKLPLTYSNDAMAFFNMSSLSYNYDATGNGFGGNLNNIGACAVSVASGGSYDFTMPNSTALTGINSNDFKNNIQSSGWIRFTPADILSSNDVLVGGTENYTILLDKPGNILTISVGNDTVSSISQFFANTWYHVAFSRTWNGSQTLYINGVLESNPYSNKVYFDFDEITFGESSTVSYSTYFNAVWDDELDFDAGSYSNTYFNTSLNSVALDLLDTTGAYSSDVFDAGSVAVWDNIDLVKGASYWNENAVDSEMLMLCHLNVDEQCVVGNMTSSRSSGISSAEGLFDTDSQNISSGNTVTYIGYENFDPSEGTVEFWFKANDASNWNDSLSLYNLNIKYDGTNSLSFYTLTNGNYRLRATGSGINKLVDTSESQLFGTEWHYMVGTWDNVANDLILYIDGEVMSSTTYNIVMTQPTTINLGSNSIGNFQFSGSYEEFVIWDRARTQEEITKSYERGSARLNLSVRSCDDVFCSGDTYNHLGTYDFFNLNISDNRYFQYQASFESFDNITSPNLDLVNVTYETVEYPEKFYGCLDEWGWWNSTFNSSEVNNIYNQGLQNESWPFFPITINPLTNVSIELQYPAVGQSVIENVSINFAFSAIEYTSTIENCSLWGDFNGIWERNQTITGVVNDTSTSFDSITLPVGNYLWNVGCIDNNSHSNWYPINASLHVVESIPPQVFSDFINESMYYNSFIRSNFNFTDDTSLQRVNITVDGNSVYVANLSGTFAQYNMILDSNVYDVGRHNLSVELYDSHTADNLLNVESYNPSNGLLNNKVRYDFEYPYNPMYIEMYDKAETMFGLLDSWTYIAHDDKYSEVIKLFNPSSSVTFVVESDEHIEIVKSPGNYAGQWLVIGDHWKDFVLENEPNSVVNIRRINDNKVEIDISNIENPKKLVFQSTGDLNRVTKSWDFYVANLTSTFDGVVLLEGNNKLELQVDYGEITSIMSSVTPSAILEFNGTNYTASWVTTTLSESTFQHTFLNVSPEGNYTHKWYFDLGSYTLPTLTTSEEEQLYFDLEVGLCNVTLPYPVLNVSYFDEVSDNPINVTDAYNINFDDRVKVTNTVGVFAENVTNHTFCTNLNPSSQVYNWDMYGLFTLTKTDYITRVFDVPTGAPYLVSNDPQYNLSMYMIKFNESTTITFNWFSTSYQPLSGTMRVYRCNDDGTRSIVESVPVIAGSTSANNPNIELLTQAYAYDIIVDGVVYTDAASFNRCHVETQNTVTYYVNTDAVDTGALIGLNSAFCSLTQTTNNSVTMSWESNPLSDSTDYTSGCVRVTRASITGNQDVYNNCSVETDGYTRTFILPTNNNNYVITGSLVQGTHQALCKDSIVINYDDYASGMFDISGLLGAFLLIACLVLLYAGNNELSLIGAVIGIVASWVIGLINFPWLQVSSLIAFLVIIAIIGRYSRKRE